jgi:beta-glucuronidase
LSRRMNRLPRVLLVVICGGLVISSGAHAAETPQPKTLYRDGPSGRFLLGGGWYSRPDPNDQGVAQRFQRQSSLAGWSPTTVPKAVNARDFSIASYMGTVYWFRKDFELPDRDPANQWVLRFESVNYRAKVWLNGKPIGAHVGAYLPFELRGKHIRRRGVNRLVVRVDGRRQKFDIPPLSVRSTGAFEGGWWNYTGILREVYLRRVTHLDLQNVFVRPTLRCPRCAARIDVEGTISNFSSHGRRARIVGTIGGRSLRFGSHRVGGRESRRFTARTRLRHPRLWWPDRPSLYTVKLHVLDGSSEVQTYTVHTGIRTLRVNRLGRVELNGRELNLRGASIHEDNPMLGAAIGPPQMRTTMGWLLKLGAHMTRAHYPLHPYFLEMCDRKGILVWSEIPVYRMRSSLFANAEVRAKALRMLRTEILRDRNHPSVMVWSIGNENASRPGTGLRKYIRKAERTAKQLDPTRLVGIATSGFPTVPKQSIYLELDALGINDYFGWYNGPRGTISDRLQLGGYLNRLHSDYPNQALFITEVGAEANRPGPAEEKGTYAFQTDFLRYHLDVFRQEPFINGALIWNLRDFRVKPGWAGGNPKPNPPVNEKGLVDDSNRPKPAFSLVSQIFHSTGPYR